MSEIKALEELRELRQVRAVEAVQHVHGDYRRKQMNEHCDICDELFKRLFFDFDGETYAQVRVGETLGYPAVLGVYTSDGCITFGINYCPRCGKDLKAAANIKPRTLEDVIYDIAIDSVEMSTYAADGVPRMLGINADALRDGIEQHMDEIRGLLGGDA